VCSTIKDGEANPNKARLRVVQFLKEYYNYPDVCLQCETPYCALPCPTGAITKNAETGVVEISEEKCVGCKLCMMACVAGVITMPGKLAIKCDLCGGDPACAKLCDWGALEYGEAEEIGVGKRVAVANIMLEASKAKII